jgi:hypothetical protein
MSQIETAGEEMLGMLDTDPIAEDVTEPEGTAVPCMALVPTSVVVHQPHTSDQQPLRAEFIAHLIATAEHDPQTRSLRRASPADARIAYGSGLRPQPCVGRCMRESV